MNENEKRNEIVTFRATPDMVEALDKLGAATQNSRSNLVYTICCAALHGIDPADVYRELRNR